MRDEMDQQMNPNQISSDDESVLDWTQQQLDALSDSLVRRVDLAISSANDNLLKRRPIILFLGSGFTKYLCSSVPDIPVGWNCNWKQLVEEMENVLKKDADDIYTIYKEIVSNHPNTYEHKLWYLKEIFQNRFTDAFTEKFISSDTAIEKLRTAKLKQWNQILDLLRRFDGVVTTNFDPILEKMFNELLAEGLDIKLYAFGPKKRIESSILSLVEKLRRQPTASSNTKFLMLFHGSVNLEPDFSTLSALDAVVVTFAQYVSAYQEQSQLDKNEVSRTQFLRRLLETCNLVILGYSLSDYVIGSVFVESAASRVRDGSHYLILGTKETCMENQDIKKLRCTYPSPDYLKRIDDMFGLKVIPLEAVAKTHQFRGSPDSPLVPTRNEGLEKVLRSLSTTASDHEQQVIRDTFKSLLANGGNDG